MNLNRKLTQTTSFTPTEQQLAELVRALGPRITNYSIKEFAAMAASSIASVHRFCKKLGLEGFKELKIEVVRTQQQNSASELVDINFPIAEGDGSKTVLTRLELLYKTALQETRELLDIKELTRAAELIDNAQTVDIYTQSHNLYPAQMMCDRLLSSGKITRAEQSVERQIRSALASDSTHVAVAISYSGLAHNLSVLLPLLTKRSVPTIFIGTPQAALLHPGLSSYLAISDSESLQDRITQFASHISVQYVLDVLYGCYFARNYSQASSFLKATLPYTALPGSDRP